MTPDDPENIVSFDRSRRRPDEARVAEFAEMARRLQREKRESGDLIGRLLRETPRSEWPRLAENDALRNSGVLDRLGKEVSARLEREPQDALAIANVATSIAESLPPDAYPPVVLAQLRAHAWKERAQALSYLGRHADALDALDRAEERLAGFGSVAHDRAIVRLVKAAVLQKVKRFDESLALLEESKEVFQDHCDSKQYLHCGMMEGALLYRRGQFAEAHTAWSDLLDSAEDELSVARLHNNVALCETQLGDFASANIHFSEAMHRFRELGLHAESIRTEWQFGELLLARGDRARAMERLHDARARFMTHGLVEEAGLCGLTIVAALISSHDLPAARELATAITMDFVRAELNERAIQALSFVTEAMDANNATAETVLSVSSYIESLRSDPTRPFAGAPA